jgi:hypothetical protein
MCVNTWPEGVVQKVLYEPKIWFPGLVGFNVKVGMSIEVSRAEYQFLTAYCVQRNATFEYLAISHQADIINPVFIMTRRRVPDSSLAMLTADQH